MADQQTQFEVVVERRAGVSDAAFWGALKGVMRARPDCVSAELFEDGGSAGRLLFRSLASPGVLVEETRRLMGASVVETLHVWPPEPPNL